MSAREPRDTEGVIVADDTGMPSRTALLRPAARRMDEVSDAGPQRR